MAGGVVAAAAAIGLWQSHEIDRLQERLTAARERATAWEDLGRQHATLLREQVPPDVLESLRADRQALGRLRTELMTLKRGAELALTVAKISPNESKIEAGAVGMMKPAGEWRNVGRASAVAVLETALSAAVAGDLDVLAGTIGFESDAREKAASAMAQPSTTALARYDSPEAWAASLAVADMPKTGTMRVLSEKKVSDDEVRLQVLFFNDAATAKDKKHFGYRELSFRQSPAGWQLMVPAVAVERYGALPAN